MKNIFKVYTGIFLVLVLNFNIDLISNFQNKHKALTIAFAYENYECGAATPEEVFNNMTSAMANAKPVLAPITKKE